MKDAEKEAGCLLAIAAIIAAVSLNSLMPIAAFFAGAGFKLLFESWHNKWRGQ